MGGNLSEFDLLLAWTNRMCVVATGVAPNRKRDDDDDEDTAVRNRD